jgi:hypothetical protein
MTSLLGARKRAEEFAAAIDSSGEQATPAPAELTELVELVGTLRSSTELPRPRPEFTATLREQLLAEAERSLAEDATLSLRPRRRGVRERRLALLASSFVLVGGSAGMAVAAQDALPGDALYPIKRGLENARADLARDDDAKGHDLLTQADRRLAEVQGIVGTPAESRVPVTIDDFTAQADDGTQLLLATYEETQDEQVLTDIRTFAQGALVTLQEVATSAEADHQDDLADAAATLLEIAGRATAACPVCAEGEPALEMPQPFLAAEEANRALDASRRAELDNDHPPLPGSKEAGQDAGQDAREDAGQDAGQGDRQGDGQGQDAPGDTPGSEEEPQEPPSDDGLLPDIGGGSDGAGDQGGTKGDRGLRGTLDDTTEPMLPGLDPLLESLLP